MISLSVGKNRKENDIKLIVSSNRSFLVMCLRSSAYVIVTDYHNGRAVCKGNVGEENL